MKKFSIERIQCVIFLALCLLVLPVAHSKSKTFKVGVSFNDIRFPEKISLAGYFERRTWTKPDSDFANYFKASTGIHDTPRVKTIIFDDGLSKTVFTSLDVIAIDPEIKMSVEKKIKFFFPDIRLINLFATHTHSGPSSFSHFALWEQLAMDKYNKKIADLLITETVQNIVSAYATLQPATIEYGTGTIDDVTFNRRGSASLNPKFHIFKFLNRKGQTRASFFTFPIHGTVMSVDNLLLTRDVVGAMENRVEKLTQAPALFISAAAGDVGPLIKESSFAEMEYLSSKMEPQLKDIIDNATPVANFSFRYLEMDFKPPQAYVNSAYCMDLFLPDALRWLRNLLGKVSMPDIFNKPIRIKAVDAGDFIFPVVPAEITTDIGRNIEFLGQLSTQKRILPLTLADSYYGYILKESDYRKGGYEACNSYYGATFGEKLVDTYRSLFQEMKERFSY